VSNQEIVEIVNVHHTTVSKWYSKYKQDKKSILIQKRGRKKGDCKRLTLEDEQQIICQLIDKNPQQLQFITPPHKYPKDQLA